MVGGLALSQLLTLYTMPVVYLYLDGARTWFGSSKDEPALDDEKVKRLPSTRLRSSGADDKF
jgi:hypothetical protein